MNSTFFMHVTPEDERGLIPRWEGRNLIDNGHLDDSPDRPDLCPKCGSAKFRKTKSREYCDPKPFFEGDEDVGCGYDIDKWKDSPELKKGPDFLDLIVLGIYRAMMLIRSFRIHPHQV